jgi:hypothetical protein
VGTARRVVRPQLAVRGLGLFGVPRHVHRLVVPTPLAPALQLFGRRIRTQACGNGVIRAGLDPHVVRRVGVDQVDRVAIQEPVHVLGLARVAAEQPVVAQEPQVAGPRDRLIGRVGHLVRIAEPLFDAGG